jgi:ribose transport system ATP-binding protein
MAAGMAFVPEDRGAEGIFGGLTVRSNLSAAVVGRYWKRGRLQRRRERSDAELLVADYGIKPASARPAVGTLSGGNQQKVMLARWLRRQPLVLLLDEPTQGVDVGARSDIYANIRRAAEEGMGVLMVSSDLEELAHVCDRVVVLRDGVVATVLEAPGLSAQQLAEATLTEMSA